MPWRYQSFIILLKSKCTFKAWNTLWCGHSYLGSCTSSWSDGSFWSELQTSIFLMSHGDAADYMFLLSTSVKKSPQVSRWDLNNADTHGRHNGHPSRNITYITTFLDPYKSLTRSQQILDHLFNRWVSAPSVVLWWVSCLTTICLRNVNVFLQTSLCFSEK